MQSLTEPTITESELIIRVKLGDDAAFEEVYRRHRRRVYSLCVRITRNSAEAEDLTQDVFLRLFSKIGTFRGESSFGSWLYRVALNVILMHARHKQLVQFVSLSEHSECDAEDSNQELARQDSRLAGSVNRVTLIAAIHRLAPGYRMVLWLHDVLGYEHSEIAEIMGCTIGSTKSQLHRARMRIRAELLRQSLPKRIGYFRKRTKRHGLRLACHCAV